MRRDRVPQRAGTSVRGLHLKVTRVRIAALLDGHCKVLEEVWQSAQLAWIDEVEQRPQFAKVVLDGRSAQYQSMGRCQL